MLVCWLSCNLLALGLAVSHRTGLLKLLSLTACIGWAFIDYMFVFAIV